MDACRTATLASGYSTWHTYDTRDNCIWCGKSRPIEQEQPVTASEHNDGTNHLFANSDKCFWCGKTTEEVNLAAAASQRAIEVAKAGATAQNAPEAATEDSGGLLRAVLAKRLALRLLVEEIRFTQAVKHGFPEIDQAQHDATATGTAETVRAVLNCTTTPWAIRSEVRALLDADPPPSASAAGAYGVWLAGMIDSVKQLVEHL